MQIMPKGWLPTLDTRAYATTGVRQVQLSVHHSFYESVRWHWAGVDARWQGHRLLWAGMRPRNALLLVQQAELTCFVSH